MTIHFRRVVIATLGLLALATTVSADGASVIWVHSVFRSKGIDEWTPGGAANSLDECKRAAIRAASNSARIYQNDKGVTLSQTGPVVEFTYSSGERASIVFVCLPDTIDPRGPKGK